MKCSIIIRAYNSEKTIERAVRSALDQEFPRELYEIIVVNDGSTDGTSVILRKFANEFNFRVINQENKGAVKAANAGFRAARGEYVVLLDGDDYCEPAFVKELSLALDRSPKYTFAYSDYYEESKGEKKIIVPKNIFETVAGGVMFRKAELSKQGFYNEDMFFPEYSLLLRTKHCWRGMYCRKILFTYSRHKNSLSKGKGWAERGFFQLQALHKDKIRDIAKIRGY